MCGKVSREVVVFEEAKEEKGKENGKGKGKGKEKGKGKGKENMSKNDEEDLDDENPTNETIPTNENNTDDDEETKNEIVVVGCGHPCTKKCHDPLPEQSLGYIPKMTKKQRHRKKQWVDSLTSLSLSISSSHSPSLSKVECSPCEVGVVVGCFHGVEGGRCSEVVKGCKKKCGEMLGCENHVCEEECHVFFLVRPTISPYLEEVLKGEERREREEKEKRERGERERKEREERDKRERAEREREKKDGGRGRGRGRGRGGERGGRGERGRAGAKGKGKQPEGKKQQKEQQPQQSNEPSYTPPHPPPYPFQKTLLFDPSLPPTGTLPSSFHPYTPSLTTNSPFPKIVTLVQDRDTGNTKKIEVVKVSDILSSPSFSHLHHFFQTLLSSPHPPTLPPLPSPAPPITPSHSVLLFASSPCSPCTLSCSLSRSCKHPCLLPCHPAPCPPCARTVLRSCFCPSSVLRPLPCPLDRILTNYEKKKRRTKEGEEVEEGEEERKQRKEAEEFLCCGGVCGRVWVCGHKCEKKCHPGECGGEGECEKKVGVVCGCERKIKAVWGCQEVMKRKGEVYYFLFSFDFILFLFYFILTITLFIFVDGQKKSKEFQQSFEM